jgi:hypothetical protein
MKLNDAPARSSITGLLLSLACSSMFAAQPSPRATSETTLLTNLTEQISELRADLASLRRNHSLQENLLANLSKFGPPVGTVLAYAGEWPPQGYNLSDWENATGWMLCDGRALVRTAAAHRELFEAIGTAHGNGSDQDVTNGFNLPDFRGLFLRGVSGDTNRDPDKDGQTLPYGRLAGRPGGNSGNRVGSIQGEGTRLPQTKFRTTLEGKHSHVVNGGDHEHDWKLRQDDDAGGGKPENAFATGDASGGNWGWYDTKDPKKITGMLQISGGAHQHSVSTAESHAHAIESGGDPETRPRNAGVHWIIKSSSQDFRD